MSTKFKIAFLPMNLSIVSIKVIKFCGWPRCFVQLLEVIKLRNIKLIYASSSSVYGENTEVPFSESHRVDQPVSLYAATKRENELIAHVYWHLRSHQQYRLYT
jgi:UDP-glucose 4-epimerase